MKNRRLFWLILSVNAAVIILYQIGFGGENLEIVQKQAQTSVDSEKVSLKSIQNVSENVIDKMPENLKEMLPENKNKTVSNNFIENEYQILQISNETFKLLRAFYDERPFYKLQGQGVVKLTGIIENVTPTVKTFCQLWFNDSIDPVISKVHMYRLMWPKYWGYGRFMPFHIECYNPLATEGKIPTAVSLVENPENDAENNFKVTFNPLKDGEVKKSFAVCTKSYIFKDDVSMQVVEWIETMLVLGADKITIAVIELHPNMTEMFAYYVSTGKVELEFMPPYDKDIGIYHNEVMGFNHCFYRHMYKYDFILPLDIDEVLVPHLPYKDLIEMINQAVEKRKNETGKVHCCYTARQVLFLLDNNHANEIQSEVPKDFIFLQHIYRAANICAKGIGPKSFQNAETTEIPLNHYVLECLGKGRSYDTVPIDIEDAKLHHYRVKCNIGKTECDDYSNNTMKDITMWRFKDQIISHVKKSLQSIQDFKASHLKAGKKVD